MKALTKTQHKSYTILGSYFYTKCCHLNLESIGESHLAPRLHNFFMLNSTEHGIPTQWRTQNAEKYYTHQRETTGTSSEFHQLCPFSNWVILLKERICSHGERILSFKSSSFRSGNHFTILGDPLNVTIFITHVRNCVMGATPMRLLIK